MSETRQGPVDLADYSSLPAAGKFSWTLWTLWDDLHGGDLSPRSDDVGYADEVQCRNALFFALRAGKGVFLGSVREEGPWDEWGPCFVRWKYYWLGSSRHCPLEVGSRIEGCVPWAMAFDSQALARLICIVAGALIWGWVMTVLP